jgi:acetyl-CoA C-acetyltransferase
MNIMQKPLAAIISAGLSKFGRLDGMSLREIFAIAAKEAFDSCPNLDYKEDIKAIFIGHMIEASEHQCHTGPLIGDWVGLSNIPSLRFESACASSGAALRSGVMAIMSGLFDIVMVGGVERLTHLKTSEATEYLSLSADYAFEQWNGFTFPALFASMARAHMHKYGSKEEHFAMVAVKNHLCGAKNPKAHLQKEITLDEVMSSKVIASPLKLYDCSLISDGASCLILTKPELAKKFTDSPVYIIGTGQASDTIGIYERDDLTKLNASILAAKQAYQMADISPKDVDLAEVHDCFSIAEILAYEALEFCKFGEGGNMIENKETCLDGCIPVNMSGGLKSKGHPVGATGAAQAYEIFLQLTDQADRRQVSNAQIGLSHNIGGTGSTAIVHIYQR